MNGQEFWVKPIDNCVDVGNYHTIKVDSILAKAILGCASGNEANHMNRAQLQIGCF